MARKQPKQTAETKKIEKVLLEHFPDHAPEYPPSAYSYLPHAIRVRVVSHRFGGMSRGQRADIVYPILRQNLPEDTWLDITMVLLLAPDEVEESLGNREFEYPSPLRL
jgi:stress-induced morphogen